MDITIYSVFSAIIWFNLFILLVSILQWKLDLLLRYNFYPILMLLVFSVIRLIAPVETPYTRVLRSERFLPFLQEWLRTEVLLFGQLRISHYMALLLLACTVSVFLLARYLLRVWREYRLVYSFTPTEDPRLLSLMEQVMGERKARRGCSIIVIEDTVPASIWGLSRPMIILPSAILSMTDHDIKCILQHEWQHYLEKDLWIKCFIEIFCRLTWWNPFVCLLKWDLEQTFELKCDLKVTSRLGEEERDHYLQAIIKLGRLSSRSAYATSAVGIPLLGKISERMSNEKKQMQQRFLLVLKYDTRNQAVGIVSILLAMALFFSSFLVVVQPFSLPPMEDLNEEAMVQSEEDVVEITEITSENSYLMRHQDGSYSLYVDGRLFRVFDEDEYGRDTYQDIPMIEESVTDRERELS